MTGELTHMPMAGELTLLMTGCRRKSMINAETAIVTSVSILH
jgi:hypothetical protein